MASSSATTCKHIRGLKEEFWSCTEAAFSSSMPLQLRREDMVILGGASQFSSHMPPQPRRRREDMVKDGGVL